VLDKNPEILLHHRAVVIGGHSEYWTMAAYNGAIAARGEGVGLAFISANEIYWQVRYERNKDGIARRVMVGYKDYAPDPVKDPKLRTIRWRDLGRPEQKLVGVQFPFNGNQNWGGQPYVPEDTDHWVYDGSRLSDDVPVKVEAVGYEIDNYDSKVGKPEGTEYTILANSPFVNFRNITYLHNSSIYRGTGGNWVWATGSMDWSWTLSPGGSSNGKNNVRRAIQVVTRNVLNRMIQEAPR
jgi:N,N-dimethylformamidase beta subunit-like protein